MSPSCLATIFEGDNGGNTTTGVSSTEIRVAIPGIAPTATARRLPVEALFEYMNQRFELYGRRLVPEYVAGSSSDAVAARALGADVATRGVFAALTGYQESDESNGLRGTQAGMMQELARQGVVTVTRNAGTGWSDRMLFDAFHPYLWSVYPSIETNLAHVGDFTCTALVGRPARHARDAGLRDKTRRVAVLAAGHQAAPAVRPLVDALTACDRAPLQAQWVSTGAGASDIRTAVERLRADGATTIVCVCESTHGYATVLPAANQLGFGPEWVMLPSPLVTDEVVPQRQGNWGAFIRVEPGPKLMALQDRPWFRALLATNPTLLSSGKTALQDAFYVAQVLYEGLLLLASGIQAAGPTLTDDTFAAGLMNVPFPNPGAGQAPAWQPTVGFGPGDHAFYDDYAIASWSSTLAALEPYSSPQGSWCYLGAGARYRVGGFPSNADSRLYNPAEPCR